MNRPGPGGPPEIRSPSRLAGSLRGSIPVVSIAFSPDGRLLAAAGLESGARVWDVARP
jgi:WD40 repeat protein